MLDLVIATSNAPAVYRPRSAWQAIYAAQSCAGLPPPNELAGETDEIVDVYVARIEAARQMLIERLVACEPDVVVVLGYDDGVAFSTVQIPQFCTFVGETLTGSASVRELGESPETNRVTLRNDADFAWDVHRNLVDRGFDVSYMAAQNPLGEPAWGTSSAFTRPTAALLADLDVVVLPIFINCMVEPAPSGRRCHAFGAALGNILHDSVKRVALLAVGGLSHDPGGSRAGWIDERLDRWVLDRLGRGESARIRPMFDVDSDTLSGGTGQIRTWIAAGAAAESRGSRATTLDYIPALRAMAGMGFAYWDIPPGAPPSLFPLR